MPGIWRLQHCICSRADPRLRAQFKSWGGLGIKNAVLCFKCSQRSSTGSPQPSMELEHAIGFGGQLRNCLLFHPNNRDIGE